MTGFMRYMAPEAAENFPDGQVASIAIAVDRPPYGVVGDPVPSVVAVAVDHIENITEQEIVNAMAMAVGAALYKPGAEAPSQEQFRETSHALANGWKLARFMHENGEL